MTIQTVQEDVDFGRKLLADVLKKAHDEPGYVTKLFQRAGILDSQGRVAPHYQGVIRGVRVPKRVRAGK